MASSSSSGAASSSSAGGGKADGDAAPPDERAAKPGVTFGRLRWHQLVGVTFFAVCGGDYGLEDAVGAAGPGLTMLGLLVLPWVWSLPIALMTAELSAMIPEAGGYVVWVHRAFGPFWAHQNAVWNLISNAFDNALYPVMFVDYLRYFPFFRRLVGFKRWLASVMMLSGVTGLNLLGVDVVASASTLFAALVISPFAALTVAGMGSLDWHAISHVPEHRQIRWGAFLSVLLWNTSGYDSVGALAAEVRHPGRDFPRAMVATIGLVALVYLLPLAVSISLDKESRLSEWTDGHFTQVAQDHVGDWLSAWISLGGALSALGLLNTLMCTAARVAASAARLHVLPRCLARLDEPSGTPRRATLAMAALLAVACALPFSELVSISMLFYGATTAFEFVALVALRYREPHTPRPYRLPLSDRALALATLPPLLLCALLVCLAPVEARYFFCFATLLSTLTYFLAHGCGPKARAHIWQPCQRLLHAARAASGPGGLHALHTRAVFPARAAAGYGQVAHCPPPPCASCHDHEPAAAHDPADDSDYVEMSPVRSQPEEEDAGGPPPSPPGAAPPSLGWPQPLDLEAAALPRGAPHGAIERAL